MKNLFQNKKILFTLILMASCFGILGVVEKGEAACSVYAGMGQEKTSYTLGETITINFKDAPAGSILSFSLYPGGGSGKEWEWNAHQSGYEQHTLLSTDATGTYQISLYGGNGTCNVIKYITVKSKTSTFQGGDCTSKNDQECVDITECVGNFTVVTSGPRKCTSGTCVERGSCKIASTVPQLPTNANVIPATPASSTTPASSINVQAPATTSAGSTVNLPTKKLSKILEDLIKWLLQIVILIAILMIIISGTMYMISAGDQQKADTAKKALTYAILGLLVVALAYAIVSTLVKVLAG